MSAPPRPPPLVGAAQQASLPVESEVTLLVLNLHPRGFYPSDDQVGSLLRAGIEGANILDIVRRNRESLGNPKRRVPPLDAQ